MRGKYDFSRGVRGVPLKTLRILKLAQQGLTVEQIARKIGQPNEEGIQRVLKVVKPCQECGKLLHSGHWKCSVCGRHRGDAQITPG